MSSCDFPHSCDLSASSESFCRRSTGWQISFSSREGVGKVNGHVCAKMYVVEFEDIISLIHISETMIEMYSQSMTHSNITKSKLALRIQVRN